MTNRFDPSKKQYGDMSKAELDLVRLQAQDAADRFIQQHGGKPFFLRIAGTIIAAAGKKLEPQLSAEASSNLFQD